MARVSNGPAVYYKARSCDLNFTRGTVIFSNFSQNVENFENTSEINP